LWALPNFPKMGIAAPPGKGVKDQSKLEESAPIRFCVEETMERRSVLRNKRFLAGVAATALLLLVGFAWLERAPLLAWYCIHMLTKAKDSNRDVWAQRVAGLDLGAMTKLIDSLRRSDAAVCAGAEAGLQKMVQHWGAGDSRRTKLAACLAERFAALSEPGRQAAMEILLALSQTEQAGAPAADLLPPATRMLAEASRAEASRVGESGVRAAALRLAAGLSSSCSTQPDLLQACRALTRTCFTDRAAANRVQAIRLARREELDLLEAVTPLLNDPAPEVRREAMLAVGSAVAAINTDDLLASLHDPDVEVRRLCEAALRSRGLSEEHVQLARLLTDSRPEVRLQVLGLLRRQNDLEPGIWLRRLSHDPAPAVRAAVVRAAIEQRVPSLSDRLEQMAQNDPSPSVRQLAQYYRTCR
jgi:hypothetical protein